MQNELMTADRTIDMFDRLIKDDNISFNEYIDIINRLYAVTITDSDIFGICSGILGDTAKVMIWDTDILYETTKRKEIDNHFEYYDARYNLYIKVAFTDELSDRQHKYSYDEIIRLVNDKKIVILELIINDDDYPYEEVEDFKALTSLKRITGNGFITLKYVKQEYVSEIYTFLKKYFSKDKLKNDFHYYIDDLNTKLNSLQEYISYIKKGYITKNLELDNILLDCNKLRQRKISKDE